MINKLKSCAIGLGLIAAFATQASAAYVDGVALIPINVKASLKVTDGLKTKTVSFTNKDILAFKSAPKGATLQVEVQENVTDLDDWFYIVTKDGNATELSDEYYAGAIYAYVEQDGYDYDYFTTIKDTETALSYKTDGYLYWEIYLYTSNEAYTYLSFSSDSDTAKLATNNSYPVGKPETWGQSYSDKGMYLDDGEVYNGSETTYPFLDGVSSISAAGKVKFPVID